MSSSFLDTENPAIKRVRSAPHAAALAGTVTDHPAYWYAQDIIYLILQYLQDEGYSTSFLTMQDEANVKLAEQQTQHTLFKRMCKAILGRPPHASPQPGPCPCGPHALPSVLGA